MRKYELSLSRDYVPNWTVVDAVRELFQNALDQQTTVEGNEMFFNYDETTQTLHIGNKSSVLNVESLLLGTSTKRNDPNTIGQFGEGYKIATLVLSRLNKKVTFYNYGAQEVWLPRFVKAKRYNGAEILTFFVDSKWFWEKIPDNNLTITVENIMPEEYQEIIESNLHCQEVGEVKESTFGRILMEPKYQGKVFVNGLFVCNHPPYNHGYDFKPQYLKIDRDRKLADSFELEWLSSKMWSGVDGEETINLVKNGAADTNYISNSYNDKLANRSYEEFKKDYGESAVPVTSQQEYESINKNYKPILVNTSYSSLIKSSSNYSSNEAPKIKKKSPKINLEQWLKNHNQCLSKRAATKLRLIIEEIKE